jgi:hypothetical protein
MRSLRVGSLLLLLLVSVSCSASSGSPKAPVDDTPQLLAQWRALNYSSYRFDFERHCFCLREATQPVTVQVRDGRVVSVTSRETGRPVELGGGIEWYTIEELFAEIEQAKRDEVPVIVEYHALGYPTYIEIGTLANDAGVVYRVGAVERIG